MTKFSIGDMVICTAGKNEGARMIVTEYLGDEIYVCCKIEAHDGRYFHEVEGCDLRGGNEMKTKEKLYYRYDMQDESDCTVETLDEIKAWISEFWTFNHSDDISEDELNALLERIEHADEGELQSIVWGIDYDFTEYIKEESK